jgi:hypothetical protein
MAGHEDTCWCCGVEWASEEAPPATLRLVSAQEASDGERWTNEGGTFASEAAVAAARR